jgi:uncharacterized repeat protein (TIGR03803 family)
MKSRTWIWTTVVNSLATLVLAVAIQPAQAQTFNVIHAFTGGQDGGNPYGGLTMDKAGNLYSTTYNGGAGYGTAYRLKRSGSNWIFNPLYSFAGGTDGANPEARVVFGPDGTLYGTTLFGGVVGCGAGSGCGTVFNLRPSPRACTAALCPWTETVLHRFGGGTDGAYPQFSDVIFDQAGNIYDVTYDGGPGPGGLGTVYELARSGSGWMESVLYGFPGRGNDGIFPGAVTLDNAGNLYGTTFNGGLSNDGTVFELMYTSGIGWTENLLYSFQNGNDGDLPIAGVIFDQSGNLYGATTNGGSGGGGTVFELTPSGGGSWKYSLLYSFTGGYRCGPVGNLVMEAGNLYGTTLCDGANQAGSVFKLTPPYGQQNYTSLHDFCAAGPPCIDGAYPISNVSPSNGKLYGTASAGGSQGVGVVWEITP